MASVEITSIDRLPINLTNLNKIALIAIVLVKYTNQVSYLAENKISTLVKTVDRVIKYYVH
jgi:hypothetical protein